CSGRGRTGRRRCSTASCTAWSGRGGGPAAGPAPPPPPAARAAGGPPPRGSRPGRPPDVWSSPRALINAVSTALIDEVTFRGALFGLLLATNLNPTVASVIQAILYTLAPRLGAPPPAPRSGRAAPGRGRWTGAAGRPRAGGSLGRGSRLPGIGDRGRNCRSARRPLRSRPVLRFGRPGWRLRRLRGRRRTRAAQPRCRPARSDPGRDRPAGRRARRGVSRPAAARIAVRRGRDAVAPVGRRGRWP